MSGASPGVDLMDLSVFAESREMPVFDELREHDPVHWNAPSSRGPGFWALTRYDHVRDAASDHRRLSSAAGTQIVDREVEGENASLHNMDDPEHAQLRRVAIPHLRAVKIQRWQQAIDESVSTLLDEAEEQGNFDMVGLISAWLPMLVPRARGARRAGSPHGRLDQPHDQLRSRPDGGQAALAQAREELMGAFAALTEQRRAAPADDLSAWPALRSDPGLLAPAIEEMFRFVTPVACMRRTALEDLTIGGAAIAKGEKVVLWFSAANRDPATFEPPHEFLIDRAPNEHLTFGWGIHFCLGAHLARAEVRALFAQALQRGLRFDVVAEPRRVRHNIFRGWAELPVRVVPAGAWLIQSGQLSRFGVPDMTRFYCEMLDRRAEVFAGVAGVLSSAAGGRPWCTARRARTAPGCSRPWCSRCSVCRGPWWSATTP